MTKVITESIEMKKTRSAWKDKSVGFVPTMGALHAGHEKLIRKARQENDLVVVSIFINPTQFNNQNDFTHYPKTWDADFDICESGKVDFIFGPTYMSLYPDQYKFKVVESEFSKKLCGEFRPGHFDGVLTVVLKLLNLVAPTRAYFGEKDFQQLELIKNMAEALFLDVEIVPVATEREIDGLAMSSRNARLTSNERNSAPQLYKIIRESSSAQQAVDELNSQGFRVDYVQDLNGRRFAAAHLGEVRLIDNVQI